MTLFHPLRLSTAALAFAAVAAFSAGCDNSGNTGSNTPPANNGGGHSHGEGEHAIGTVTIEGRTVTVKVVGELEANKPYPHCHLEVTGEPVDSMYIWIGDPTDPNPLKANVTGLGSHPVVDLETPADLDGAVLAVEIKVGDETHTALTPLVMDHDEHGDDHDHDGDGHDDHNHDHGDGGDHDHDGDGHPDH